MARIRYSLLTIFLWGFMLAWWAGVVLWVATTGAWPMGSEPVFVWPFWMGGLSLPAIAAYLSWEYLWDQEKQRRSQITRDKLPQAKENEEQKAPSARGMKANQNSEGAEVSESSPLTLVQEEHSLNSEAAQCAPRSEPAPAAPAIPSTATCVAPRNVTELKLAQQMSTAVDISPQMQPSLPIDGGDEFLDDCEKALRELMHPDQKGRVDQKGTV